MVLVWGRKISKKPTKPVKYKTDLKIILQYHLAIHSLLVAKLYKEYDFIVIYWIGINLFMFQSNCNIFVHASDKISSSMPSGYVILL